MRRRISINCETKVARYTRLKKECDARNRRQQLEEQLHYFRREQDVDQRHYEKLRDKDPELWHEFYVERILRWEPKIAAVEQELERLKHECPDAFAVWKFLGSSEKL